MRPYVILADATCDLSEDVRKDIGMTDYLAGHVYAEGVREFPFTLDWSEISRTEFYKMLSKKNVKVNIPEGNYVVLAQNGYADADGIGAYTGSTITAGATSATILAEN